MTLVKSGPSVREASQTQLDLRTLLKQNPNLCIPRDNYNINVTSNSGERLDADQLERAFRDFDGAGDPAHLYYHVPLCSYLCHFCNYVKKLVPKNDEPDALQLWADLLVEESRRYLRRFPWVAAAQMESFYMGGGTAGLLLNCEAALRKILDHSRQNYSFGEECEWNIEGNPDNFDKRQMQLAVDLGFNRFSVGIQSFEDPVNEFTKRKHSSEQSVEAVENLIATGFPFNVDMMFGLPLQTVDSVRQDMVRLVEMGVPTITIYRLRNVDREALGIGNRSVWNVPKVRDRLIRDNVFPTLEETYDMRQSVVSVLLEHRYYPSPCGWWSAPDTYPQGNIPQVSRNKWQNYDTMIAYGPGAYGWLTGVRPEVVQTHNQTDISTYVDIMQSGDRLPLSHGRHLTGYKAIGATLGFNFKANQPIVLARYRTQFGVDLLGDEPFAGAFSELLERGLVEMCDDQTALRPTLNGEALHEEIIEVYLHKRIGLSDGPMCRR